MPIMGKPEICRTPTPKAKVRVTDTRALTDPELVQLGNLLQYIVGHNDRSNGGWKAHPSDDPKLWRVILTKITGASRVMVEITREL
jgi:hypothetical protein